MKKLLVSLAILTALFFAINMASRTLFTSTRMDLTESKLFTLSPGTKNILGSMEEPVTLRVFYSASLAKKEAPVLERISQRVTELLDEYVAYSDGMLTVLEVDPEPFSEEEDQAVEFGMRGIPVNAEGELVYFGVAGTNSIDDQETIPFIELPREDFLEYDFTKLIYSLANPKKHRVGILSTLPIHGAQGNPMDPRSGTPPWFFVTQLEAAYDVEIVDRIAKELPKDIDILVLVHPKKLDPQMLFQIDQFVLKGGRLIAFLDPHCEGDGEGINPQDQMSAFTANRTSDLGPLTTAWGFSLVSEKIAADKGNAHRVRLPSGGDMPYLGWLDLNEENLGMSTSESGNDPIISELKKINMATAGILEPTPDATTTFQILLHTGPESMQVERIRVAMQPDPEGLMSSFVSEGKELTLGARISGPIKTAYPGGIPEAPVVEGQDPPQTFIPAEGWRTEGEAQIIVFADADMLMDQWWVQFQNFFGQRLATPTANNADLLINSIDNLTGSSDLIGLRSRQGFERPFTLVEEIRASSEERFREEEKALQAELTEAEARLAELQSKKEGAVSSLIITPEEREEIEKFEKKRLATRKKLRDVKYSLKKDINALGTRIKFFNFAIPLLVALAGLAFWVFRSNAKAS